MFDKVSTEKGNEDLKSNIIKLSKNLKLHWSIKEMGKDLSNEKIKQITQGACATTKSGTIGNYKWLTQEDVECIIRESLA